MTDDWLLRRPGFVVALLGAESTGKSTLAHALRDALIADGVPPDEVVVVPEFLREFCDAAGRTPRIDEQAGIAATQTMRIAAAAERHAFVVADTSALLTAVYHEQVFDDRGLYAAAETDHIRVDLTLVTALDLPWVADGLQRDGPHVRGPVDARIRAALDRIGRPYTVVHGAGAARVEAATAALRRALGIRTPTPADAPEQARPARWTTVCERCGDAACERRSLLSAAPPTPATAARPA